MTARRIDEIAEYLATDPDGLGVEPDAAGVPAIVGAVKRYWPSATAEDISEATQVAIGRVRLRAARCFAEADTLKSELANSRRGRFSVIEGGKS